VPTISALHTDHDLARQELQRVATHVLARARYLATGHFGLRVTWDGIGTPAFGPDDEVLRICGGLLVHESQRGGTPRTRVSAISGSSLEEEDVPTRVDFE
jgi:hypothetical protein